MIFGSSKSDPIIFFLFKIDSLNSPYRFVASAVFLAGIVTGVRISTPEIISLLRTRSIRWPRIEGVAAIHSSITRYSRVRARVHAIHVHRRSAVKKPVRTERIAFRSRGPWWARAIRPSFSCEHHCARGWNCEGEKAASKKADRPSGRRNVFVRAIRSSGASLFLRSCANGAATRVGLCHPLDNVDRNLKNYRQLR